MGIDWHLTADIAVEKLETATAAAVAMLRSRCEDIARLETKNAELKALVATLEDRLRAADARNAELESENAGLRLSQPPRVDDGFTRSREPLIEVGQRLANLEAVQELERLRIRRMAEARYWQDRWLSRSQGTQPRRSSLPGQPGYVDPFWPKEKVNEWAAWWPHRGY